jgi:hypothetical protein
MAAISLTPVVLKDSLFTLDGNDFSGHVSNVTFTPTTGTVAAKGLTPTATYTRPDRSHMGCVHYVLPGLGHNRQPV